MAHSLVMYLFFSGTNLIYLVNLSIIVRMAFISNLNIGKAMIKFIVYTAKGIVEVSIECSLLNNNYFEDLETAQIGYILIYISTTVRNLKI
jgi:hypothetical protein